MKKIILLLALTIIGNEFVSANNNDNKTSVSNLLDLEKPKHKLKSSAVDNNLLKVSTIDNLDTVVFDMFNSNVIGNKVSFPIKFFSDDDPIFALDFSFKFNQLKLVYDTTINLKPAIFSSLGYYNPTDSTVRFTSSGLSSVTYPDTIDIAIVRFTVLSGTLTPSDLKTIKAFLNGDPCSNKVTPYSTVGISDVAINKNEVILFPNPTQSILKIKSSQTANFELMDLNGRSILKNEVLAGQIHELDLSTFSKGIYMMKVFNDHFVKTTKVVIK
jgi:hypothetical protein